MCFFRLSRGFLYLCIFSLSVLCITDAFANQKKCPQSIQSPTTTEERIHISTGSLRTDASGSAQMQDRVIIKQANNTIQADKLHYHAQQKILYLEDNILYTKCNIDSPAWHITANKITLEEDQAIVDSAWLILGNTPVFYLPYLITPVGDKRKSGLLFPNININSNTGFQLETPYYLNLMPNQDATITPRLLLKRGLQLDGEFRYLQKSGSGEINADWLHDDEYADNRYSYQLKHKLAHGDNFHLDFNYQRVSDLDYLDDLGEFVNFGSNNYLSSYMQIDYVWEGWQFGFYANRLQTSDADALNNQNQPYEIQPGISVAKSFISQQSNIKMDIQTAWEKFKSHDASSNAMLDGERIDSLISIGWDYQHSGFHFTPNVKLQYTKYKIDETNQNSISYPNDISRTIPSFNLRTGLIFKKENNNSAYTHTLEPELFYLNVAHKEQQQIPIFDTGESDFRYSELFNSNRFNNNDRISSADQLTLALTKRIIHTPTGKQTMRASLGQIYYFRNSSTALYGDDISNDDKSDIAGEALFNLNDIMNFHNTLVWDTTTDKVMRLSSNISFNRNKQLINLFYRYRKDKYLQKDGYKQAGINFSMSLSDSWNIQSSWAHDFNYKENLNLLASLEYQSCCWSLRLTGQHILKNIEGIGTTLQNGTADYETFFGIELNLTDFFSIGNNSKSRIKNSVFGYP